MGTDAAKGRARLGPILSATVACERAAVSAAAYCEWLGYSQVDEGVLDEAEAIALGAPQAAGRAFAVVGCSRFGRLRFVDCVRPAGFRPLRHLGWAALELAVTDVDATARRLADSPFRILRPPAYLSSSASLRAMQVAGPDDEVLYLTQRLAPIEGFDLPEPTVPVDRLFIAVLACADLERSRAAYEAAFAVRRASDRHSAIRVLNDAFDLPEGTTHRLSTLQLDGSCLIEFDQYPREATPRPSVPGELPWGIALVSLATTGLDRSTGALRDRLTPVASGPGGVRRVVGRGASGELFELVEGIVDR
ncbi:MAG TPA: hypothetical protein VKV23_01105 [Acidimicrobiales bacterium]|nr:hypothetical protein [Acidimicrobiales bacterium]